MRLRHSPIWAVLFVIAGLVMAQSSVHAQQAPHIGYVFPAGARQGSQVVVTVGGQFLQTATGARLSGEDVHATVLGLFKPLSDKEMLAFRDSLIAAHDKLLASGANPGPVSVDNPGLAAIAHAAGMGDAELAAFVEHIREGRDPKRQLNPQLAERATLQIAVDPKAAPGVRLLRLIGAGGLSNPIRFVIGDLPEIVRSKPADSAATDIGDTLPVVLNGQILPGEVDRYKFHARKGFSLVAECDARELMPYLADTVPGWFQAAISLVDPHGREIAYADHYLFHQDPVLHAVLAEDGIYTLEVRDALYRGREDFVYRLSLGRIPCVETVFPLGGEIGTPTAVEAFGWNLPKETATVEPVAHPGIQVASAQWNPAAIGGFSTPFGASDIPETTDKGAHHTVSTAMTVSMPIVVNGRIESPGEHNTYRLDGRAGQTVVAEIQARRLGSPLDSVLELSDSKGKVLAVNDDYEDTGAGLVTDQADSYLTTKLPANGAYFVTVWDARGMGGADYGYRLRLSEPRPDFDLRVLPSALLVRPNGSASFTVDAIRRDGFAGDIVLDLVDAPAGFTITGGLIRGGSNSATVTLHAAGIAQSDPFVLHLEGSATGTGSELRHEAVPADDMMQAFAYHHIVPADDWLVSVLRRAPAKSAGVARAIPATPAVNAAALSCVATTPQSSSNAITISSAGPPPSK